MITLRGLILAGLLLSPPVLAGADEGSPPDQHLADLSSHGINRADQQQKPYVILVSLDGFRADYLDRFDLPNFRHLIEDGVRAEGAHAGLSVHHFSQPLFNGDRTVS